ncbi:MAG: adenylate/guanylate cyclase domain-containing protein [Microcoleus sp. CSU_2_2]|nr:adenylate/guanylate cyclase domain-containing protein [Microcoleus sp. SU_5_3]NJS09475.1 adenylate/guanylate cyclase domain-containing protein [Microcoleus sp. CSU_2_2]
MKIELLAEKIAQLKKRPGASGGTLDQIENWLNNSYVLQRMRINPYYVTGDLVQNVKRITSEFLHGVKAGVFDLHWDIHCPHCNMMVDEFKHLGDASEMSLCPMCEREFKIDLEQVEVTFSLNQEIDTLQQREVCDLPPLLHNEVPDKLPDDELTLEQLPLRLSGIQLLHHPDYKRLFGEQVISERERVKIRAITIMFTDITGSTRMYETLGDAKAYNIVRDHFEIFFESIERCGGKIIKTIGDAVMASFINNEQAIMAAADAVASFREYNSTRQQEEWIQVRIGIHRGTALLVNLNNSSDYFGSTVNKAARIQNLSKSDEVSFSEEVYNDRAFLTALKAAGVSEIQKRVEDLKGIQGAQVAYTARINTESVIALSAE